MPPTTKLRRQPLRLRCWGALRLALAAAALSPAALAGGLAGSPRIGPDTYVAIREVVALFEKTPVVAIGELHGMNEQHTFLRALIADPAFGRQVHSIVVEFGNALYQPVADAYILNQRPVSRDDLRQVWRNTTQSAWNTWDAPIYEQFFQAVRAANLARPRGQAPIRIILGDPPINWAKVRTQTDAARFFDRDGFCAGQVEREVLARNERALLIAGLGHVLRSGPLALRASGTALERMEARHPGQVTVLMVHAGFPDALRQAERRLLTGAVPRLVSTHGTWLGQLKAASVFQGSPQAPLQMNTPFGQRSLGEVVDGMLVLGNPATFTLSVTDPKVYRDPVFAAELRRRKHLFGIEHDPQLGMAALFQPAQIRWFTSR